MVNPTTDDPGDPVLVRRRRIAHWVGLAKRVGYSLLLLAVVGFVAAAISGFDGWLVTLTVVALISACVVLPVPIVLGYGLRAAERDEREAAAVRARKAGGASGSDGPGGAGGVPPATRQ